MFKKIKNFFKKKEKDLLYLKEETKFNNIDDLKKAIGVNSETKSETKSSLTFGK